MQLQEIIQETLPMSERFTARGFKLYLVGGIVRDLYMHQSVSLDSDIDLATDAHPKDIKACLQNLVEALWSVGERYGTIGCLFENRIYEVTTFRTEAYSPDSRKPRVKFGSDIYEDLVRRDFTINAMAIKLPGGETIDPHHGSEDLVNKVLRSPASPEALFQDDPLRMLRAARFEADLGLLPAKELTSAMAALSSRIDIVSKERRLQELKRLLSLVDPGAGLSRLQETGLLQRVLPKVPTDFLSKLDLLSQDWRLRLAGLYLPIDKLALNALIKELSLSRADAVQIKHFHECAAVGNFHLGTVSEKIETEVEAIKSFAAQAKSLETADKALELIGLTNPEKAAEMSVLLKKMSTKDNELFSPVPKLSGTEIMEILGLQEGPEIGKAKAFLKQLRLKNKKLSKRQETRQLKSWWLMQKLEN